MGLIEYRVAENGRICEGVCCRHTVHDRGWNRTTAIDRAENKFETRRYPRGPRGANLDRLKRGERQI